MEPVTGPALPPVDDETLPTKVPPEVRLTSDLYNVTVVATAELAPVPPPSQLVYEKLKFTNVPTQPLPPGPVRVTAVGYQNIDANTFPEINSGKSIMDVL
jgi:hypothetical protein